MTTGKFVGSPSIRKELTAKEFYRLATRNPQSIRRSRFIIPKIGSGLKGKFLVEFENGSQF